jgi:hypothetical protein
VICSWMEGGGSTLQRRVCEVEPMWVVENGIGSGRDGVTLAELVKLTRWLRGPVDMRLKRLM